MIFQKKKLKAVKGILTFLFINIKNYVGLAERVTPEQLIGFIKNYINKCDIIISKYGGQIWRIEADRILSVWPDDNAAKIDACKSCECAIELVETIPFSNLYESKIFRDFAVLISISRGECIYVKKKNEIIEAFGDAVIRVEKINGAEYHLENMILVDDFLKSKCNNFKYKKVDSEDNVFFLVL